MVLGRHIVVAGRPAFGVRDFFQNATILAIPSYDPSTILNFLSFLYLSPHCTHLLWSSRRPFAMPLRANAVEVNGTSFPQVKPRPGMRRMPTNATRYMEMLLELDSVPAWHNMAVAIAAWMLLASFMILPGTFATIQEIDAENGGFTDIEQWVLSRVRNLPLLVVAGVCCGLGALGMMAFWLRWRNNYVWICNRVFLVRLSFLYSFFKD